MATKKKAEKDAAQDGKSKAAELAIAQIKERYGDGAIMKLGESQHMEVEAIPSGCLSLDIAFFVLLQPHVETVLFYQKIQGRKFQ